MLLTVEEVVKHFGGVRALNGVSLTAAPGSVTGIIGPNGSGKSTLFDVITGIVSKDSGQVMLDGMPVDTARPELVVGQGITRTFQVPRVVRRLTVLENLMLVPSKAQGESVLRLFSPWHVRRLKADEAQRLKTSWEMAETLGLDGLANDLAGTLSGGQLKLLSTGMAFMMAPPVMLLDEATAGVNPVLIERILDLLSTRREMGLTTVVIEHNMYVMASICDTVYVLDAGEIIAHGTPDEVREDQKVVDAYLGLRLGQRHRVL
jgi:ABC-type branched-subunit amino acid transport system ATPase component